MRILPLNNYNYQSKVQNNAQNNKQQNVNFGLLCGTQELSTKCRKLAWFCKAEDLLKSFLSRMERVRSKQNQASVTMVSVDFKRTQEFTPQNIAELIRLKQKASVKNVLVAPGERFWLHENYYGVKSTEVFLQELEAEIDAAKPIDQTIQIKLEELEPHADILEDVYRKRLIISQDDKKVHSKEEARLITEIAKISRDANPFEAERNLFMDEFFANQVSSK